MKRRSALASLLLHAGVLAYPTAWATAPQQAAVLRVGPSRALPHPAAAARALGASADGPATIEIDAGTYEGDAACALWTHANLHIRAVGGPVVLNAAGASMEGKGIWVVRAGEVLIEGITFTGSRVANKNGAGIRFEGGNLTVRDCRFLHNENGILTSARPTRLALLDCEFEGNGHGDGYSHGVYTGEIEELLVADCHFRQGRIGHLVKSRARRSVLVRNRLVDGIGGTSSYEAEFPNGGDVVMVGNTIEQAPNTDNPILVSFGIEGWNGPQHRLLMAHNTLINRRAEGGQFLRVAPVEGVLDVRVQGWGNVLRGPGIPGMAEAMFGRT